jgi:hypothetical protein
VAETTKQRLLEYAARRLGGRKELAGRLKVDESLLAAWMDGHATMPDRKLVILADLIADLGDQK